MSASMISVTCSICDRELTAPGALLFSPPTTLGGYCRKYHICRDCWTAQRSKSATRRQRQAEQPPAARGQEDRT